MPNWNTITGNPVWHPDTQVPATGSPVTSVSVGYGIQDVLDNTAFLAQQGSLLEGKLLNNAFQNVAVLDLKAGTYENDDYIPVTSVSTRVVGPDVPATMYVRQVVGLAEIVQLGRPGYFKIEVTGRVSRTAVTAGAANRYEVRVQAFNGTIGGGVHTVGGTTVQGDTGFAPLGYLSGTTIVAADEVSGVMPSLAFRAFRGSLGSDFQISDDGDVQIIITELRSL